MYGLTFMGSCFLALRGEPRTRTTSPDEYLVQALISGSMFAWGLVVLGGR